MKKGILSLLFCVFMINAYSQCNEIFISQYVEGYANNRALELYNPTANSIDLSGYSVGRFSNGGTSLESIQLPADMIAPYGTYTIVLDKRDSLGVSFEIPVWNGYQLVDTLFDSVTGDPVLDSNGDVVLGVQYNADGVSLFGNVYREEYDLKGKADVFLCPTYAVNNSMYFNGDDAVALISGTMLDPTGNNLIDVVGVIGEDPGESWLDGNGSFLTKDRTLTRNADIQEGEIAIQPLGDTLNYSAWTVAPKNSFTGLGSHGCNCDPNYVGLTITPEAVEFNVFPNPASSEWITVQAETAISTISVVNTVGQEVVSILNVNMETTGFSADQLPAGLYFVNVTDTDNRVSTSKLILR